jgi:GAF domain-containing protein
MQADQATAETRQDGDVSRLHRFAARVSAAAHMDDVAKEIADLATETANCGACGVYLTEGDNLILNPARAAHPASLRRLKIQAVVDATGWAAGGRELVAVAQNAWTDPRAKIFFSETVEDRFEWFVSIPMVSAGRLAGAINLLGRNGDAPGDHGIELIATAGLLAGSEIERLRLASENADLTERLETRKIVERAKGILQRNLSLSEEEAYLKLQRESRQRRKSMKEVAEAIVLNEELNKKK